MSGLPSRGEDLGSILDFWSRCLSFLGRDLAIFPVEPPVTLLKVTLLQMPLDEGIKISVMAWGSAQVSVDIPTWLPILLTLV